MARPDGAGQPRRELAQRPARYTGVGLAGSALTLVGLLGLLLAISPLLVALAMLSVMPALVIQRRASRRIYAFWYQLTPADRERGYVRELLSEARWAKEIRAFGLEDHLQRRYRALAEAQLGTLTRLHRQAATAALVATCLGGAVLAASYAFMAWRGATGHLTAGDLTASIAAIAATAAIAAELGLVGQSLLALDQHASFLDDYFSFLALPRLLPVAEHPAPAPSRPDPAVEFREVSFRYPEASEPALTGFNLAIAPGELVALVGDNGAGKTSAIKLLLRLYDPQQGAVLLDGVDLRDLDPRELRSRIGILFQDYATYQLTARDNVVFGRAEVEVDEAAVVAALEAARASRLVARLPRGLDSNVGRLFDGARDLSAGEWQRLALARLLYRRAAVWVLDEPTAAMDPEAEAEIFAELRSHLRGRTGIVISHRFSTVRTADRIAVVAGGRVRELGTHAELIAAGGRYAELFELQAAGYR